MRKLVREEKITVRLSGEELALCDALARRHGIDYSGVMRQALLRWAREEAIEVEPRKGKPRQ